MNKCFICSPYAGNIEKNVETAKKMCKRAIQIGQAPFAPHLLYPQFLSEEKERGLGISCGIEFLEICDTIMILDVPPTRGMLAEIGLAKRIGMPVIMVSEDMLSHWHGKTADKPDTQKEMVALSGRLDEAKLKGDWDEVEEVADDLFNYWFEDRE